MDGRLYQLVCDSRSLFWGVPEDKLAELNEEAVVEAVLNYGRVESVKRLFEVMGIHKVAEIFYQQTSQPRHNYLPQTSNYFNLYFQRHAA